MDFLLIRRRIALLACVLSCTAFAMTGSVVGCGDSESGSSETESNSGENGNNNNGNNTENNDPNGGNDNNKNNDNGPNNDSPGDECDATETVLPQPVASVDDDPCRPDGGWNSAAIFVATHGDNANDGQLTSPLQTIQAGLDKAVEDEIKFVLVENGTYTESVELRDGIHLLGGYDVGWSYHRSNRARIEEGNPTLTGEDIETPTRLRNLRIDPFSEAAVGESVVTAYLRNSSGVIFDNVHIYGGRAGDGIDGEDGVDGTDGERGTDGEAGDRYEVSFPDPVCNRDSPGSIGIGGSNICVGSNGGNGGEGARGDNQSENGKDGGGGASGGVAGGEDQNGQNGANGLTGSDGEHGVGGAQSGYFEELQWVGEDGTDGVDGGDGTGGGGGGAGGGDDTGFWGGCDHWGGSGGGGGSGGCKGTAGTRGTYGGASIALFLEESDPEIRESRIEGGTGGDGGQGGELGEGGDGRGGGAGGSGSAGNGGDGGNGGDAGDGGHGGGGAGGPAFAIFSDAELTTDLEDSRIEGGSAGTGGGPAGGISQAEDGLDGEIQVGL